MSESTGLPKDYGDHVAPAPEWGDETMTAEQFIRHNLVEAMRFDERTSAALTANMAESKGTPGYDLTMQKYVLRIVTFLFKVTTADLMMTIKKLAPEQADDVARNINARLESGDYYPEMVWSWLRDRGIDPERIRTETIAAIAAETSSK